MKKQLKLRIVSFPLLFSLLAWNAGHAVAFDVQVTEGDAVIARDGDTTTVTMSGRAVFEGDTSILAHETVKFVGTDGALLRDMTGARTEWLGSLLSQGMIVLVNTHGVYIADAARIDVASLIASTLNIQNELFLTNQLSFQKMTGANAAEILNRADIRAADGGYVILLSDKVRNDGKITAYMGSVALGSGEKVSVSFDAAGLVNLVVDEGLQQELRDENGNTADQIVNSGEIRADGGRIEMTARLLEKTLGRIVNNEGILRAGGAVERNGEIEFVADGGIESMGTIQTGYLKESGASFRVGGVLEAETSSIDNLDDAITYAADTDVSGAISDAANIVVNAGVTLNMTADTTFWADSDQSGLGAFLMDPTADITGNAFNLTLRASENSTVGILSGIGTLTLQRSHASSTPVFSSSTTTDDIGVTTFYTRTGVTFSKTVGDGSGGTPYLVYDVTQLQGIADLTDNYLLANNINAADFNFDPIGSSVSHFTGSLDGNGHTISNLTINRSGEQYMGLIAYIGTGGSAEDIRLTGVSIQGSYYTGGLTGYNDGSIADSYTTGTVTGEYFTGGLVGRNSGTIEDSYSQANVTGTEYTGGLIGRNEDAVTVTGVYATGNVSGDGYTGGLIGENATGNPLANVYATGAVTGRSSTGGLIGRNATTSGLTSVYATGNVSTDGDGDEDYIGGLVGYNSGTSDIANSYATGTVNGNNMSYESDYVGGLVGYNAASSDISGSHATGGVTGRNQVGGLVGYNAAGSTIEDSYATGNVHGNTSGFEDETNDVGGLVGENEGVIDDSYATGNVRGDYIVGGLVGSNSGTITDSYSEGDVTIDGRYWSGYEYGGGLVGNTSPGGHTVTNSYYNIDNVEINGQNRVTLYGIYDDQYQDWVGGSYVALDIDDYLNLNGGYYEITNLADLKNILPFAHNSSGLDFRITANINLGGLNFTIPYLNVDELDGGGFAISNLGLDMGDFVNVGFISYNASDVTDLHLTSGTASGGKHVGGLVGYNNGTISDSHTAVDVTGDYYAGGFAGANAGTIQNSYSEGDVDANEGFAYGFVGSFYTDEDSIINSYYNIDSVLINDDGNAGNGAEHRVHAFGLYDDQYDDWIGGNRAALVIGDYFTTDMSGSYIIANLQDMKNILPFVNTSTSSGLDFVVTSAIDFTAAPRFMIPVLRTGLFDGGDQVLSNLTSDNEGYIYSGFIGMAIDPDISNLVLSNFDIKGGVRTGGMVGTMTGNGTIAESSFQGSVLGGDSTGGLVGYKQGGTVSTSSVGASSTIEGQSGYYESDQDDYEDNSNDNDDGYYVGGLVGRNSGNINDSHVAANVQVEGNDRAVGGLIGYQQSGTIADTYVAAGGTVTGQDEVGGLIGYDLNGTITGSYSLADVTGTDDAAGGLIGYANGSTVSTSYSTGDVDGEENVGGFIGTRNGGSITYDAGLANMGAVSGSDSVGGLIGRNTGAVSNFAASNSVTADGNYTGGLIGFHDSGNVAGSSTTGATTIAGDQYVGGLIGYKNAGDVTSSHSVRNVSGAHYIGGLAGYNNAGNVTSSYATGTVTASGSRAGGLLGYHEAGAVSGSYSSGSVSATSGYAGGFIGYREGGTVTYTGNFPDLGHVSGGNYVGGLIGWNEGAVSGFDTNNNVTATGSYVGGLIGHHEDGAVSSSYSTGATVTGDDYVGGLIGNHVAGNVTDSYATRSASGDNYIGGLIGNHQAGNITDSYATGGAAATAQRAGGLLGHHGTGAITDSYATGTVSATTGYAGGLIGYRAGGTVTYDGALPDLGDVSGGNYVGGLIGWNAGDLADFAVNNDVDATGDYVGGLVGYKDTGAVTGSHSTGAVSGDDYVGGLIGRSAAGAIQDSYATGNVTASGDHAGGFIGRHDAGNLTDTYSTGTVTGSSSDYVGGFIGRSGTGTISGDPFNPGQVSGGRDYVGAFIGYNEADVSGFSTTRNVSGRSYVGGFIGYNAGDLSGVNATGQVTGVEGMAETSQYIGGLVGYTDGGEVEDSYATGAVSASDSDYVGGLIGYNDGSDVLDSYTTGTAIDIDGDYAGGLIGYNAGAVSDSYSTRDVTGRDYVGGLIGRSASGLLEEVYSTGDVTGRDHTGGLIGRKDTGNLDFDGVFGEDTLGSVSGRNYVGGLIGYNAAGSVSGYFTDNDIAATGDYVGGFVGYNGSGSIADAHSTGEAIEAAGDYVGGFAGYNASGAISDSYSDRDVEGGDYVGGFVGYNDSASISGSYALGIVAGNDHVGGFVGRNESGTLSESYAIGLVINTITGNDYVGGFAGSNAGAILRSFARGSVTGADAVGGFVGDNADGAITNAYSVGSVSGATQAGGFVGTNNNGTITNAYSSGPVSGSFSGDLLGTYNNSFLDLGHEEDDGGVAGLTGLQTSDMTVKANFTGAGWDFASVWEIDEVPSASAASLPYFQWQVQVYVPYPVFPEAVEDSGELLEEISNNKPQEIIGDAFTERLSGYGNASTVQDRGTTGAGGSGTAGSGLIGGSTGGDYSSGGGAAEGGENDQDGGQSEEEGRAADGEQGSEGQDEDEDEGGSSSDPDDQNPDSENDPGWPDMATQVSCAGGAECTGEVTFMAPIPIGSRV